jgi:Tol biopolymer transport system component
MYWPPFIEQMTWSPDGSKLAFGTTAIAGARNQVYVHDFKSGGTAPIFECERFDGEILWSPNGKQLMVPSNRIKNGVDYLPVTNILQFN